MLGQPVGLGALPVDVHFTAVDVRVGAGVAVDAEEVVGGPGVGHIHPGLETGGVGSPQALHRGGAGDTGGKAGVAVEKLGQALPHQVIHILLPQAAAFRPGVGAAGVVALVDENANGQRDLLLSPLSYAGRGRM